MTDRPGVHIVFACNRCPTALPSVLSLPAANYLTIDGAYERAKELNWTFAPDGDAIDGTVVCPRCRAEPALASATGGRSPDERGLTPGRNAAGQPATDRFAGSAQ